MTHTSCIKNKPLEIRPSFVKFNTNVYDFYTFTYYMHVFSMQKTKRAFHQLKTVHQLQKAFSFNNFQSLSHSTPKQAKKLSQVLKVRIKSYIGLLLKIYQHAEERQKVETDETNGSSYLLLATARPDFSTATYPVINMQEKLKGKGATW